MACPHNSESNRRAAGAAGRHSSLLLQDDAAGVVVAGVREGSPLRGALAPGDVVRALDGETVDDGAGATGLVQVRRNGSVSHQDLVSSPL